MSTGFGDRAQMKREQFIKRGAATVLTAASVGWILPRAAQGSPGSVAARTQTDTARTQTDTGTLVLAVSALMSSLDREYEIGAGSIEAMTNVFDPLTMWPKVRFGSQGSYVPRLGDTRNWVENLLDDIGVAADGRTWTLKFKRGIASHSGNELTAADYVYALQRHQALWALGSFYNFVGGFLPRNRKNMFRVVDKYTARVNTQKPSPVYRALIENNLAEGPFDAIEARKHATASDPWSTKWMKTDGWRAGHGPFVIDSHTPGSQTVFRAFSDYHRGAPKVQTVVHRLIDSSSTRASLLQAGQVDVVRDLLPADFKKLEGTSGVVVDDFDKAKFLLLFMMMNTTKPPFNNKLVRQALSYAAPYDRIVKNVYQGYADPWNGIISRDYPHFANGIWPYGKGGNFAKAKSLLKKAGYPNGFSVNVLYNASEPLSELVAIELRTAFAEVGVKLKLQKYAAAAFTEKLSTQQFDTAVWLDLALSPDIGYCCYLFFRTGAFSNMGKYSNPQADRLIDQILTTLDDKKRAAIARQFQRLILDDAPQLYLAQPHYVLARRENVKGVTSYTSRALRFDDVTKV